MPPSRRSLIKSGSAAALLTAGGRKAFAQQKTIQIGFPYELSEKFVAYPTDGATGKLISTKA